MGIGIGLENILRGCMSEADVADMAYCEGFIEEEEDESNDEDALTDNN